MFTQAFIDGAGDASNGAFLTFAGLPTNELKGPGEDYFKRMSEILGHAPDGYSTYSYDSTVAVIQAIDKAGEKDRGKILDALMGTTNFTSLVGKTWSFTETGTSIPRACPSMRSSRTTKANLRLPSSR